jgi:GT2 family glycosyltransferase
MLDVSIIIVNYNTSDLIIECIESIKKHTTGLKYEIIVVDNNSIDNSVKTIEYKFKDVIVIPLEKNLGFGVANNIGAKHSKADYIFLLNSDTLLMNNAISILIDFMRNSDFSNVGTCGGNLYKSNGTPNFSYSTNFPSLINIFLYRSRLSKIFNQDVFNYTNSVKEVSLIIGADLLINRKLFNKIAGFDEAFFMYIEDGDLQYRLYKMGYKMYSVPTAKIYHLQGASSNTYFKLKMEIIGYIIYFKKHFSSPVVFFYKAVEVFFVILKILYFIFFFRLEKVKMYSKILIVISKS